jgi:hypothetical protein
MEQIQAYLAEKPCHKVTEDNGFICLVVVGGRWNACKIPEIAFPFIKTVILAARIEE